MRECEHVFFTADGTNIEYDIIGSGEKLLVIHDSQGAEDEITTLCSLLARRNTVFCPARRGWGFSGSKGWDYSMDVECSDLIQMMDKFEIENVYGMRYGAVVAMHLALRRPVKKMVLQSPYLASLRDLRWLPKMRQKIEKGDYFGAFAVYRQESDVLAPLIPYVFRKAWLKWVLSRALTDTDLAKQMVTQDFKPERLIHAETVFVQLSAELTAASEAEPELAGLSSLATETLLLCDCGDESYTHASVEQLLTRIPNSRKEVTNLTQIPPKQAKVTETRDFLEAVTEFLA